MYLKKLSAQGFKSFANRTTFEFNSGVTSVVGPNGSGKSNVADALRWVLGEQSSRLLRARKAEDVIFAGTKDRPAVGMAEVILTLDNSDHWLPVEFAEVEVGRRIYRDGDSEYLLNGSRVRLRDIIDLLMKGDVGQNSYSIMGQGLVDEVLTMTPDERRGFLDEAADVKRFRMKIKEAQDRLAATRENIAKVTLIVSEIEPRLAQLSRQAERAGQHRELSAELTQLLRAFYTHRYSDAQNQLVRARATLDQCLAENATAAERVTTLREQLRALGEEIRRRREAISRRESAQVEVDQRISVAEQNIALDRERHSMLVTRSEEVRREIDAIELEKASFGNNEVDDSRRSLEIAAAADQAKQFAAQCREGLELAEREYAAARSEAQELRDGAQADDRRVADLEAEAQRAQSRIAALERDLTQVGPRRAQLLAELKSYGRRFAAVRERVAEAEFSLDDARLAAEGARERLRRVQDEVRAYEASTHRDLRELDHLEGRLDALRRVQAEHDGVAAGTRNALIMGQALVEGVDAGSLGEPLEVHGVLGLLSRQLRVPAGLEVAINAALEQRLHAVIVQSEDAALKAIDLLYRRRGGRAQFLALDTIRNSYPLNLQKEKGVLGVASKLVKCDKRFQQLTDTLLGRVIVVDDVQVGLKMIRRSLGSVVTVDGTYIEATGVVSGGATGADEGPFVRQRELEELPPRIAELQELTSVSRGQLEQGREAIEQIAIQAKEADTGYEQVRRELETGRLQLEQEREKLHRLRRELEQIRLRSQDQLRERTRLEANLGQSERARTEMQARAAERRTAMTAVAAGLEAATERREAAIRAVSEASGRLATVEGERRSLQAMREQHEKSIERLTAQVGARKMQARNLELEANVIDERIAKLTAELATIRTLQGSPTHDAAPDRDELVRFENHERQVQEELAEAQEALLRTDRRRLDLEGEVARLASLIESLESEMGREGLTPDRAGNVVSFEDVPALPEAVAVVQGGALLDPEETRLRIEEIRRQIRRLGPINAEAPEDYRESKERYEFLTTQMRDLADAEVQLREAIQELSGEIKQRFGVTFENVNKAFGEYFSAFFGGGTGQLLLTDPEDMSESGIEIEAQPPGKRIKSLSLLSGGERSLTAVALLFALLAVNPAPFCVLDEVDAALDEANVGRFTQSLARLSEKTQFIVITHNRRTVEVADAIYGVSMGRDGVSKVLSLRLTDIPNED
ncbi:MAG: chromosome segregation protein SMC [Dehalococcoidia bacterium]